MDYKIILPENYIKPKLPDKSKWVIALRSKKYLQGKIHLKGDETYCCLGVLCEIENIAHGPFAKTLPSNNIWFQKLSSMGYFPADVWVETPKERNLLSLAGANDHGLNFDQIADIIDQIWD